ncbi:hypothetical protein PIIN_06516 [Serendipita indica DSM 11827]|uniref:Uncharacterized protein n=1 Tax=Serendipita indica (strain DSM 11827) TaxID=1109443 RepID=G4TMN6_SERID|nr:hypothetical protein PIIN_06516 [Serendipita indica DSM 11827]
MQDEAPTNHAHGDDTHVPTPAAPDGYPKQYEPLFSTLLKLTGGHANVRVRLSDLETALCSEGPLQEAKNVSLFLHAYKDNIITRSVDKDGSWISLNFPLDAGQMGRPLVDDAARHADYVKASHDSGNSELEVFLSLINAVKRQGGSSGRANVSAVRDSLYDSKAGHVPAEAEQAFQRYIQLAVFHGVIVSGGLPPDLWIQLKPGIESLAANLGNGAQNRTETPLDLRERESLVEGPLEGQGDKFHSQDGRFKPLLDAITRASIDDDGRAYVLQVESGLDSDYRTSARVTSLSHYIELASEAGLVTIGGKRPAHWVQILPSAGYVGDRPRKDVQSDNGNIPQTPSTNANGFARSPLSFPEPLDSSSTRDTKADGKIPPVDAKFGPSPGDNLYPNLVRAILLRGMGKRGVKVDRTAVLESLAEDAQVAERMVEDAYRDGIVDQGVMDRWKWISLKESVPDIKVQQAKPRMNGLRASDYPEEHSCIVSAILLHTNGAAGIKARYPAVLNSMQASGGLKTASSSTLFVNATKAGVMEFGNDPSGVWVYLNSPDARKPFEEPKESLPKASASKGQSPTPSTTPGHPPSASSPGPQSVDITAYPPKFRALISAILELASEDSFAFVDSQKVCLRLGSNKGVKAMDLGWNTFGKMVQDAVRAGYIEHITEGTDRMRLVAEGVPSITPKPSACNVDDYPPTLLPLILTILSCTHGMANVPADMNDVFVLMERNLGTKRTIFDGLVVVGASKGFISVGDVDGRKTLSVLKR